MDYVLDVMALKKRLRRVRQPKKLPETKTAPSEQQANREVLEASKEHLPDGSMYLLENVVLPIIWDHRVYSQNLDMKRFTLDDISALGDFYNKIEHYFKDHYDLYGHTRAELQTVYRTISGAQAETTQAVFL